MVAEKLNPTPSNLIDLGGKLHDAFSQLTLESKDIPPQSPLMSPSPPPPTAATSATFHPRTNVDATPPDATDDLSDDELTEGAITPTEETRGEDALAAGDENSKEKKSIFDLAWEAMAAQGIDVTGGKNMTAIVKFLDDNPEWLEENTISNDEPSILQRGRTLKIEDLKQTCLDYTGGASDAVPETMDEYLAFLGDRTMDDQMMDVFAYVADNIFADLVNKESEYDLYEKQAAGLALYLANPPTPISPYYQRRYETYLNCLNQILDIFDSADYSNENHVLKKEVSYLTTEMLTRGSLPDELLFPFKYQAEVLPIADDEDD